MTSTAVTGELIAQRYRVTGELGRGGVGQALAVFDEQELVPRALKRLLVPANERQRELFEGMLRREYAILAQFAHPNVVSVFDFGLDRGATFYTMERLVGVHPGYGGPMPWREVCRMLVTLCSPLALLHSRGWVHRDISPRNVFLTENAVPKLLDFGAMAALDEPHSPVGAPPFLAPETLRRERIDARTDLFGLGALAYFALTGRHAFPARTLDQLPRLWQTLPTRTCELVRDIPEALDDLVRALLSLEMDARPRQLAEVVARLTALAGLPSDGVSTLAQACLTTPGLIGRDMELTQLKRTLQAAASGRSASCLLRAPSGTGCTRLLDALAVEAEVLGQRVLRADATLAGTRAYALARELGRTAGDAPELEAAGQELDADPSDAAAALQLQAAFQAATQRWSSGAQPVLIVVDDCDRADLESLQLLAGMQRWPPNARASLVVAVHAERKEWPGPLHALAREATTLELQPLSAAQLEQLLHALFGDVSNLTRLSHWLAANSGGLPGPSMQIVRHLVDSGRARFVSGSWQLPDEFDEPHLSEPKQAALNRKLDALSQPARELLELLALVTQPAPLPTAEYRHALRRPEAHVAIAEGELMAEHILVANPDGYALREMALSQRARERRNADKLQALHAQLGEFYASRRRPLYAAYHFWQAGRTNDADQQVTDGLNNDGASIDRTSSTFAYSRDVSELYAGVLAHRQQRGAAPLELYPLRVGLLAIASMSDARCARYTSETIAQLRFDAGLDFWESDREEPAEGRTVRALMRAHARYDALPPDQRGLSPELAVRAIAHCVAMLTGVFSVTYDAANMARLPGMIVPLRSLSPALELIATMAQLTADAVICNGDAHQGYLHMLGILAQEVPGLGATMHEHSRLLVLFYIGLQEAQEGMNVALERAAQLQEHPLYEAMGLTLRRIHALARARFADAQRYTRQRELVPWAGVGSAQQLKLAMLREAGIMLDCHDLLELTRIHLAMRERALLYPGWQPWEAMCRAFQHLAADEPAAALEVCKEALDKLPVLGHGAYPHLIKARAWAHVGIGQHAEAERVMSELLSEIERRGLLLERPYVLQAVLAVAEAGLGKREQALARIDAQLAMIETRLGDGTLAWGRLCEARCHAALLLDDPAAFSAYLKRIEALYSGHPSLRARHARWSRIGHDHFAAGSREAYSADFNWDDQVTQVVPVHSVEHQGEYLLSIVLDELDLSAGQLYRISGARTLQLMAARPSSVDLTHRAAAQLYYDAWQTSHENETVVSTDELEVRDLNALGYAPLWLTHPNDASRPVGLLLLPCSAKHLGELSSALLRAISQHLA